MTANYFDDIKHLQKDDGNYLLIMPEKRVSLFLTPIFQFYSNEIKPQNNRLATFDLTLLQRKFVLPMNILLENEYLDTLIDDEVKSNQSQMIHKFKMGKYKKRRKQQKENIKVFQIQKNLDIEKKIKVKLF